MVIKRGEMNYYALPGIPRDNIERRDILEDDIMSIICDYYKCSREELIRNSHKRVAAGRRFMAFYLMKEHLGYNHSNIGLIFHKHHSTVLFGINKIKTDANRYEDVRKELNDLETIIRTSIFKL